MITPKLNTSRWDSFPSIICRLNAHPSLLPPPLPPPPTPPCSPPPLPLAIKVLNRLCWPLSQGLWKGCSFCLESSVTFSPRQLVIIQVIWSNVTNPEKPSLTIFSKGDHVFYGFSLFFDISPMFSTSYHNWAFFYLFSWMFFVSLTRMYTS